MKGIEKLELKIYSYSELCRLFEQETKKAHSKDSQLKEWARWFSWERITTHKFLVTEIFSAPQEKQDGRKNNGGHTTAKYLALDDLIMDYICGAKIFSGTSTDFLIRIGVLSSKFKEDCIVKFGTEQPLVPRHVIDCFNVAVRNCVHKSLQGAFDRLKKEEFIMVESYFVLHMLNGNEVAMDKYVTEDIIQWENEVLSELELTRQEVILNPNKDYTKKVKEKILENLGYDILYYYKKFDLQFLSGDYDRRSGDTMEVLTRKYVVTVANAMLKVKLSSIENESSKKYSTDDLIRDTMELIDKSFVYMNTVTWRHYYNEKEQLVSSDKGKLFWDNYILARLKEEADLKREEQKKEQMMQKEYRYQALEELGEETLLEFEQIIPNLNWCLVFSEESSEREEYVNRCERALDAYYDTKKSYKYYKKQDVVTAYQFYLSQEIMNGKEKHALLPFYKYEELYNLECINNG